MRFAQFCIKKRHYTKKPKNRFNHRLNKKTTLIFLHDFIYWVCIQPMVELPHVIAWCLHTTTTYNRTFVPIKPILDLRVKKFRFLRHTPKIFAQLCIKPWHPIDNKKNLPFWFRNYRTGYRLCPPFFYQQSHKK